jgi:hypothetical protein
MWKAGGNFRQQQLDLRGRGYGAPSGGDDLDLVAAEEVGPGGERRRRGTASVAATPRAGPRWGGTRGDELHHGDADLAGDELGR